MVTHSKVIYRTLVAANRAVESNNNKSATHWKVFRLVSGFFAGTPEAFETYKKKCYTSE